MPQTRKQSEQERRREIRDIMGFLTGQPPLKPGEKPEWFFIESKTETTRFRIYTTHREIGRFDKVVLDALLAFLLADETSQKVTLETTKYVLAKDIFYKTKKPGSEHFSLLKDSLEAWSCVRHEYCDHQGNKLLDFKVFEALSYNPKTGKISVTFSKDFLEPYWESGYFTYFDRHVHKAMKEPLAARLYEVLAYKLGQSATWKTKKEEIAGALELDKPYSSHHITVKLKALLKEVNEKTGNAITVLYDKNESVYQFQKAEHGY